MLETISSLLIVIGAILVLHVALRALGLARAKGSSRRLRVVDSCALGQRQYLHVVEVDGGELLIGATEHSVRLLKPLSRPPVSLLPKAAADQNTVEAIPVRLSRKWMGILRRTTRFLLILVPTLFLAMESAHAVESLAGATQGGPTDLAALDLGRLTAPEGISSTLQIVILMTLLSVAPSLLLMVTCFTRIVIVLSLVRQAIGIHQLPPNQVIVGLALFTTFFVMAPVAEKIHTTALKPYMERTIDTPAAVSSAAVPIREFLSQHTREKDVELFLKVRNSKSTPDIDKISMAVLVPAYLISEIRTAFEIGFMLYLPFLVIDIVIASMLISMGMIMLPPIVIALPFKLMLFVLIDGWNLVVTSLVTGLQ